MFFICPKFIWQCMCSSIIHPAASHSNRLFSLLLRPAPTRILIGHYLKLTQTLTEKLLPRRECAESLKKRKVNIGKISRIVIEKLQPEARMPDEHTHPPLWPPHPWLSAILYVGCAAFCTFTEYKSSTLIISGDIGNITHLDSVVVVEHNCNAYVNLLYQKQKTISV